jgi:hypothetical protein
MAANKTLKLDATLGNGFQACWVALKQLNPINQSPKYWVPRCSTQPTKYPTYEIHAIYGVLKNQEVFDGQKFYVLAAQNAR